MSICKSCIISIAYICKYCIIYAYGVINKSTRPLKPSREERRRPQTDGKKSRRQQSLFTNHYSQSLFIVTMHDKSYYALFTISTFTIHSYYS